MQKQHQSLFGKILAVSQGKIYETLRELAQGLGERDPFVGLTARRSAVALATTEETAARLRFLKGKNVKIFSQVGLSQPEIQQLEQFQTPPEQPIRFISVGRLLHWNRTLSKIGESHVLLHPSLHDSGGFVCTEMMGIGRPAICLDLGGPATQVTSETGIKVKATDPESAVQGLAEAIVRLAGDPQLRSRLGKAGQKRVREVYDWNIKGQFFSQLCEDIVHQKSG